MADNIKIIGNIGDVERVSRFKLEDTNLLPSNLSPNTSFVK